MFDLRKYKQTIVERHGPLQSKHCDDKKKKKKKERKKKKKKQAPPKNQITTQTKQIKKHEKMNPNEAKHYVYVEFFSDFLKTDLFLCAGNFIQ